jgi:ankyrin repeat protein
MESPLIRAIKKGDISKVYRYSKSAQYIEELDQNGNTPLILACLLEHFIIARHLIDRGANVNAKGQFGWTPLMAASVAHDTRFLQIVQLLLKKGADVAAITDQNGITMLKEAGGHDTALHLACRLSNNPSVVITLIEADGLLEESNSMINYVGSRGTPLYECKQNPALSHATELLVSLKADNSHRSNKSHTSNNSNVGFRLTPKNYAKRNIKYNAHFATGGRRTRNRKRHSHSKTRSKNKRYP